MRASLWAKFVDSAYDRMCDGYTKHCGCGKIHDREYRCELHSTTNSVRSYTTTDGITTTFTYDTIAQSDAYHVVSGDSDNIVIGNDVSFAVDSNEIRDELRETISDTYGVSLEDEGVPVTTSGIGSWARTEAIADDDNMVNLSSDRAYAAHQHAETVNNIINNEPPNYDDSNEIGDELDNLLEELREVRRSLEEADPPEAGEIIIPTTPRGSGDSFWSRIQEELDNES